MLRRGRRFILHPSSFILVVFLLPACPSPQWNLITEEDLEEGEGTFHTVSKGDTLLSICRHYGVDLQDVVEENDLDEPYRLRPGERLFIPGAQKREAERPPRDAGVAPPVPPGRRHPPARETGAGDEVPSKFKGMFAWPVKGVVVSRYGVRGGTRHQGIDIAAPKGTPVLAAGAGTVIYSDNKLKGYGNLIILKHDGGFITVYAHNNENLAREGAGVRQGQRIATVGATGNAEAPHLHFEVREGAKSRNPMFFLP
jgi:murein DD-endopeptidase MepM/ murein hydrolase activator NlpD